MFIDLTPEQRQLQAELRQYFSNLISSDEMKAMEQDRHNEAYRAVIRRMGRDGKLGVGWPKSLSAPTPMSAISGRACRTSSSSWAAEPWWATLRTS